MHLVRPWVWDVYIHVNEIMAQVSLHICAYTCDYERLAVNVRMCVRGLCVCVSESEIHMYLSVLVSG